MTYMLAEQFLVEIRNGSRSLVRDRNRVPLTNMTCLDQYVSKLNPKQVQVMIQNKLRRTHSLALAAAKVSDSAQFQQERQQRNKERATRERRASRRKLVCAFKISLFSYC